tara:strand:+ start:15900 stop:16166 length:267 start_codon:yes stop_codon:yes gene_type:complete
LFFNKLGRAAAGGWFAEYHSQKLIVRSGPLGISATIPFSAQEANRPSVDAIEEIRLRTWARKNYIKESQRDDLWHPVILDEMLRIDQE